MNYKMIRFVISWVLKVEGMLMLFPALVGAMYQEKTGFAYLIWGLLCIAAGLILCFRKPSNMEIYSRDGFVCVSLSWVVLGVFGAVPFVITGEIPFYINALFEIVSGFTTTGASILSDVEALSHASLFWKSFSRTGWRVLEKLFPLDWRYGRSCVHSCIASDEGRFRHEPDEGREPGTDCFQICSESARNR